MTCNGQITACYKHLTPVPINFDWISSWACNQILLVGILGVGDFDIIVYLYCYWTCDLNSTFKNYIIKIISVLTKANFKLCHVEVFFKQFPSSIDSQGLTDCTTQYKEHVLIKIINYYA